MYPEQAPAKGVVNRIARIKENRFIRKAIDRACRLYVTAAIMAAPALPILGAEMVTRGAVSRWVRGTFNDFASPLPPKPEDPFFFLNTYGEVVFPSNERLHSLIDQTMNTYDSWQNMTQYELQTLLEQPQPERVYQAFEHINMNFLHEGVSILQIARLRGLSKDEVLMDFNQHGLWINNERFELANGFERQLASSIIQTKIHLVDNKLPTSTQNTSDENPDHKEYETQILEEDLAYLEWLKQHTPEIYLEKGGLAFIPRTRMVELARLVQAFDKIGVKNLAPITWCGNSCVENGMALGSANPLSGSTFLEAKADIRVLAHEWAHSNFLTLLPKFTAIRGSITSASPEDRFKYVTEYAMTRTWEDFAETFSYYVSRGDYFRSLLEEVKVQDSKSYAVLKSKYDFMKNEVANGIEFTDGGRVLFQEEKQKEEEFRGLFWDPQSRVLSVQPNPSTYPGRSFSYKVIPVITPDKKIHDISVSMNLKLGPAATTVSADLFSSVYSRSASYIVDISNHANFINSIVFKPLPGDDRVYVFDRYNKAVEELVQLGARESITLTPDQSQSVNMGIKSRPPILAGQERRVLESPPREIWTPREPKSSYYVERVTVLNDSPIIKIVDGKLVAFWDVELKEEYGNQVTSYYGEIPDHLLGEEVISKSSP